MNTTSLYFPSRRGVANPSSSVTQIDPMLQTFARTAWTLVELFGWFPDADRAVVKPQSCLTQSFSFIPRYEEEYMPETRVETANGSADWEIGSMARVERFQRVMPPRHNHPRRQCEGSPLCEFHAIMAVWTWARPFSLRP
jgi:hypothetical protein